MDADPRAMLCRVKGTLALCVLVWGCVDARSNAGADCARNSQCAAPLVCALERCRNECNQSRDCPIGSTCVRGEAGFGVCLLADEASCSTDVECSGSLVCRFDRCTVQCGDGCALGTECRDDVCFDPAMDTTCTRDGDCELGVCLAGRCLDECRSDRDCRFGRTCASGRCGGSPPLDGDVLPDGAPLPDSGVVDPFCPPRTADVVDICTSPRGNQHTCAVLSDGRVACWGSNSNQKLGSLGLPSSGIFTPTVVDGIDDAVRVACAGWGSCAVHTDGGLSCWGNNIDGRTGTNSIDNVVATPRRLLTLSNVVDVSLHGGGGCAIDGTQVYCWGTNEAGELGTPGPGVLRPVVATLLPAATAVSMADGRFTGPYGFVISTDGELVRFGADPLPVGVDLSLAETDLVGVATGEQHVCVLRSTGAVLCAGDNFSGQLGVLGAPGTEFAVIPELTGVSAIRARASATCAITPTDGWCWGENTLGSLGVGSSDGNQPTPGRVVFPTGNPPTVLESGYQYGCGIAAGLPYCFGFTDAAAALGFGPDPVNTSMPTTPVICLP